MDTRAKGCNGLFRSVCCVACTVYMCVAYSPLFPTKEKPGQIPIWTPGQRDVKACSGLCAVWHVLRTCVACTVYMCGMYYVHVWHTLRVSPTKGKPDQRPIWTPEQWKSTPSGSDLRSVILHTIQLMGHFQCVSQHNKRHIFEAHII